MPTRTSGTSDAPLTRSQAARLARRLMPVDGNLDGFLTNLAEYRGRPIKVIDQTDPDAPSGMWWDVDGTDCIIVDAAAGPSRRTLIIAHEIAHIMLGHTGNPAGSDLLAQSMPHLNPALVARIMNRHDYGSSEEQTAEGLATTLAVEQRKRQRAHELKANPISARLR